MTDDRKVNTKWGPFVTYAVKSDGNVRKMTQVRDNCHYTEINQGVTYSICNSNYKKFCYFSHFSSQCIWIW